MTVATVYSIPKLRARFLRPVTSSTLLSVASLKELMAHKKDQSPVAKAMKRTTGRRLDCIIRLPKVFLPLRARMLSMMVVGISVDRPNRRKRKRGM
jgi:hypothetical protein